MEYQVYPPPPIRPRYYCVPINSKLTIAFLRLTHTLHMLPSPYRTYTTNSILHNFSRSFFSFFLSFSLRQTNESYTETEHKRHPPILTSCLIRQPLTIPLLLYVFTTSVFFYYCLLLLSSHCMVHYNYFLSNDKVYSIIDMFSWSSCIISTAAIFFLT